LERIQDRHARAKQKLEAEKERADLFQGKLNELMNQINAYKKLLEEENSQLREKIDFENKNTEEQIQMKEALSGKCNKFIQIHQITVFQWLLFKL
jgi:hypothetical protein